MQSQLSNPAQRAQHRIAGVIPFDILVASPGNQTYVLSTYVTGYFQVTAASVLTNSGTITVAVKRIRAGVTTTVAGLSALAASSTIGTTNSSADDTSLFQPGDQLVIVTTANAAAVDLSVTVQALPMGTGN